MPRVIVLDNIAQEGLDLLESTDGFEFEVRTKLSGDDLKEALAGADGAILRSGVTITPESLEGNKRLKAIVRAGVGTDNIDKEAATRGGIVVMNTPTGNTVSTAEHTMTLLLGLSRNVAPANQSLVEGRWDRKLYMGAQVAGKTLGVIGVGRIGREVIKRAQAFQMKVIGYDPYLSTEQMEAIGVQRAEEIVDMLPLVDYLTVHVPGGNDTQSLIGEKEVELLKPGARLINCARGGIYDEAALAAALDAGKIAGVALDVYKSEPCTDSPLFGKQGVLCTPHLGASTEEAQTQVAVEGVHLLINYLSTGEIRHAVNVPAVDPKTLESLRGYLDASYRLGMFMSQWHKDAISSCTLNYRGEVSQKQTKLLTAAFCAGLIENIIDGEANIINAEVLLQERGVTVSEQCDPSFGAFSSSITATVTGNGKESVAAGTLFGNTMSRLVRLNDYRLEAMLDGKLLVFTHHDVPGIIGRVGTHFGKYGVNIAQMSVGRSGQTQGAGAVGVLNLDDLPTQDAIDEMEKLDGVTSAQVIVLPGFGETPSWLQG